MKRLINFSAGPSMMPLEVLKEIEKDFVNYKGLGLSVMEMSHRSKDFDDIINEARETLKDIMHIPDNYEILFLPAGSSLQFSMIPMNLVDKDDITYYAVTGLFANNAYKEGVKLSDAKIISTSEESKYSYIPSINKNDLDTKAKYVHITVNNTVYGTMYNTLPDTNDIPLIGDMSSIILGKNYDVNKFGLIYASAQKNIGASGLSLVIMKKDLINKNLDINTPTMLRYDEHIKNKSIYNTPPTFGIYVMGLMFKWVKKMGGVDVMEELNIEKSKMLYDTIDNSKFYKNDRAIKDRSIMNVVFTLPNEDLTKKFIDNAKNEGMINIKAHSAYEGIRVSLYNAVTKNDVKIFADFMNKFERENK